MATATATRRKAATLRPMADHANQKTDGMSTAEVVLVRSMRETSTERAARGQIRREVAKEATHKARQNSKITKESRIASRLKTKANGLRARSSTAARGGTPEPERVWRCSSTKTRPKIGRAH